MDHANYEIGVRFDDKTGAPLFIVDGKRLGTVQEVKDVIERYEALRNAAKEDVSAEAIFTIEAKHDRQPSFRDLMIKAHVDAAIAEYDRTILPLRIAQITSDRRVRG